MIKEEIYTFIDQLIEQLKKEKIIPENRKLPKPTVEIPPAHISADGSCNIVSIISQEIDKPAVEIMEITNKIIPSLITPSSPFVKVEFMPPVFLNFSLAPERVYQELKTILGQGKNYGKTNLGKREKILFEFVSANPTGPLHVGHGRGAAIGDSLARIFSFLGWEVKREYYINDIGNQIENLGKTVKLRIKEFIFKKKLTPEEEEWLNNAAYRGEYIKDIIEMATKIARQERAGVLTPADIEKKPESYFSKIAMEENLEDIKKDLEDFSIKFDIWSTESDLYQKKKVEETISQLKEKGYAYEKDNALWFKSTLGNDEKDRVLIRADGRPTYLAGDLAYHRDKLERKFDRLINLWGADHHGYIARMKTGIKALGYKPEQLQIILYQLVSLIREGQPVAMSTRAGEFVTLRQLLDEVGKDACRYFFLTRSPEAQLQFDLDLAKKQSPENPVYYIQYAHTRAVSIFRQAEKEGINYQLLTINYQLLKEKSELDLIKKLSFFPDILVTCAENLSPHNLAVYLLELANLFHRYYEKYRVISEDRNLTLARLSLVEAVRTIIRTGLDLIGVSAPEKM
jgi:arginyl-tRNA synthetase